MDSVLLYHRILRTDYRAGCEVVSDSDWIDGVLYDFFLPACRVTDRETRFSDENPKGIKKKCHCGGKEAWQEHLAHVAERYAVRSFQENRSTFRQNGGRYDRRSR